MVDLPALAVANARRRCHYAIDDSSLNKTTHGRIERRCQVLAVLILSPLYELLSRNVSSHHDVLKANGMMTAEICLHLC